MLNLWQKNAVFTTDVIQPIFDLAANPDFDHTSTLPTMENSPKLSNYIFYVDIIYYFNT